MAEETMVKEVLTEKMINAGAELIRKLDLTSLVVRSCLWFYLSESNTWRLIIASPEVARTGPRQVYGKIQSVLLDVPEGQRGMALSDISAVEDNDPLISLLRTAIKTGNGISGIRFSRSTVNGQFIEDAYIYRLT